MTVRLLCGDNRDVLQTLANESVDSCVTDPPYALESIAKRFGDMAADDSTKTGESVRNRSSSYSRTAAGFMGQKWDTGEVSHDPAFWREVYRVLKPGAYLLAFGGTRTYHRLACAIEDAGFEVRDMVQWIFGSGFPKSHNVSKAIDKAAGAERKVVGEKVSPDGIPYSARKKSFQTAGSNDGYKRPSDFLARTDITAPATDAAREWEGWGSALKPACEPIVMARKPLSEKTIAANVLRWGTGAINIGACLVEAPEGSVVRIAHHETGSARGYDGGLKGGNRIEPQTGGRWPANVIHDGSEEVLAAFPDSKGQQGDLKATGRARPSKTCFGDMAAPLPHPARNDTGSAARFFHNAADTDSDWLMQQLSEPDLPSLGEDLAIAVLSRAVAGEIWEPQSIACPVAFTGITPAALRKICEGVIALVRNFDDGSPPVRLIRSDGIVSIVAVRTPSGVLEITASLLGAAEPATFNITLADVRAQRTYYNPKAGKKDRAGSKHPTVKPIRLLRNLSRLVTPPGGIILDPFAGTGTLAEAAHREGFDAILVENGAEYQDDIRRRLAGLGIETETREPEGNPRREPREPAPGE